MTLRALWPFRALELATAASIGVFLVAWFLDGVGVRPCGFDAPRSTQCVAGEVLSLATFGIILIAFIISFAAVPSAALRLWRAGESRNVRHYVGLTLGAAVVAYVCAMFVVTAYRELKVRSVLSELLQPNSASLSDAFSSLRCACCAAKRGR